MHNRRKADCSARKNVLIYAIIGFIVLGLAACGGENEDVPATAILENREESATEQVADSKSAVRTEDEEENKTEEPIPLSITTPEPAVRDMHDELKKELEEKVRALYERRLLLHEAVRTIVAEEIESTAL